MSHERLTVEFGDASYQLRQAATEEVASRHFNGIGPVEPRIVRIIVEYDDPQPP